MATVTNEYEALGKALAEAIDPVWVPEAVAAVVEFLTSDEATVKVAKVIARAACDWTHNDCGYDDHAYEHANWGAYVDDARAVLLAAVGGSDD